MYLRHVVALFFLLQFFYLSKAIAQIDSTNLPLFIIDTNGKPILDEPKTDASLSVIYHENQYNSLDDSANVFHGNIGIEIRGKYSSILPQKPYGFETRDSLGKSMNIPLFHMPEENDWILLANYNDKTFLRNALSFKIFNEMGHYAPRTQFAEVIVNKSYQGIYLLTEKIKRDPKRVNISKLNIDENTGDNVTGGYIIKVDYYDDFNSWVSNFHPLGSMDKNVHFVYEYPSASEITSTQKNYIQKFIDEFEKALYSPNTDSHQKTLSNYIDFNSFVDYFILNELARNIDGYKKSSFFYKDKDSKGGLLHAGPVWDFDWAWKNINECYFGATDGSGWAFQIQKCDPWPAPPSWMVRLMNDPIFTQRVNERYFSLRNSILNEDYIFNYIDSAALVLGNAQTRHYQRWPILGINVGTPETDAQPTTFAGEISKFKEWITVRLNWLDANIPALVVTGLETEISKTCLLYPNPVRSELIIRAEKSMHDIAIYTPDGKSMISIHGNDQNYIILDVRSLTSGFYLIRTLYSDGSQQAGKFVKVD